MDRKALIGCGLWLFISALAAGCASANPAAPTPPSATAVFPTPTQDMQSEPLTNDDTINQLVALLPDAVDQSNACIDCHRDADLLQMLGEEEDVPEVPSEGSG